MTTYGTFVLERITLKAKKVVFVYEPLSKTESATPLSSGGASHLEAAELSKRSQIFCFPRAESLEAKLYLSRYIHIDKARSVELECTTGWNDVEKLELRLRAASAGLRLHTADAVVVEGSAELAKSAHPKPGIMDLANLSPETNFKLRIPYELESHISEIVIRVDAEYSTSNGTFQFFSHSKIPIDLPLDVNVQDTFKPFALFSTFNIRTPDYKPLRLLSARLGESTSLSVQGPMGGQWPRIVFPKKAMSLQFTMKQKETGSSLKESLPLDIEYQCLNEQIEAVAESTMAAAIASSEYADLHRLICPVFADRLLYHITEPEFALIASRDQVNLPSFADFGWDEVLEAVSETRRFGLQSWLQSFHETYEKMLLGNINDSADLQALYSYSDALKPVDPSRTKRRITISVSIPTVHVIPIAALNIHGYTRTYLPTDSAWPVGEPRTATLSISHTRRWSTPAELKEAAGLEDEDGPLHFVYEVEANPDLWLIGGPRRGMFWQEEGEDEKIEFELLLVPLRKGDWAVPGVDVRAVRPPKRKDDGEAGGRRDSRAEMGNDAEAEGEPEITCECYYEDAFQRVLVVPDVRSTTVGLMNGGGTVLLDTIGREKKRELDAGHA